MMSNSDARKRKAERERGYGELARDMEIERNILRSSLREVLASAEALERKLAEIDFLADEWWGRATEACEPPTWRRVTRELRAAIGAADD